MLFALLYLVVRRVFGLAGDSRSDDLSKDVEILVLRHQLNVLRRQAGLWGSETPIKCLTCGFATPRPRRASTLLGATDAGITASLPLPWGRTALEGMGATRPDPSASDSGLSTFGSRAGRAGPRAGATAHLCRRPARTTPPQGHKGGRIFWPREVLKASGRSPQVRRRPSCIRRPGTPYRLQSAGGAAGSATPPPRVALR